MAYFKCGNGGSNKPISLNVSGVVSGNTYYYDYPNKTKRNNGSVGGSGTGVLTETSPSFTFNFAGGDLNPSGNEINTYGNGTSGIVTVTLNPSTQSIDVEVNTNEEDAI